MKRYDFANILFAGPCNLRCPYCIGKQIDPALQPNTLSKFPLRNLNAFIALLKQHKITEISFTGSNTDPQLYRHEARLLDWLKSRLPPVTQKGREKRVQYSLHTNGRLALKKMAIFNCYNRASISFPSFKAEIYRRLTGAPAPPNLAEIMRQAQIPVKVSAVLTAVNADDAEEFLDRCGEIGVKRVAFRQLFGDTRVWPIFQRLSHKGVYRNNPVYSYHGIEVTWWRFDRSASASLNLFSNGLISNKYLLVSRAGGKARPHTHQANKVGNKEKLVNW